MDVPTLPVSVRLIRQEPNQPVSIIKSYKKIIALQLRKYSLIPAGIIRSGYRWHTLVVPSSETENMEIYPHYRKHRLFSVNTDYSCLPIDWNSLTRTRKKRFPFRSTDLMLCPDLKRKAADAPIRHRQPFFYFVRYYIYISPTTTSGSSSRDSVYFSSIVL